MIGMLYSYPALNSPFLAAVTTLLSLCMLIPHVKKKIKISDNLILTKNTSM